MTLDAETRTMLRQAIDQRRRELRCDHCDTPLPYDKSGRRRYCNRLCANRHWHVRRRALAADLAAALPLLEQVVMFEPDRVKEPALRVVELAEALLANESLPRTAA